MKKIVFFMLACIMPVGMYGQDATGGVSRPDKADSLAQAVNELSSKLEKMEEDKNNESVWEKRSKYFQIGYTKQKLTSRDVPGLEWKSDLGISIGFGNTYYLPKRPLFNMLKFGIDATWLDISYTKYADPDGLEKPAGPEEEDEEVFDLGVHQVELGMHVGPSVTVNPINQLKVSAYFHYIPTASIIILNDEANASYVSNFAVGGAVAYKAVSIGIESRWGKADYNSFGGFDGDDEEDYPTDAGTGYFPDSDKNRLKTKSVRFYLTFRF